MLSASLNKTIPSVVECFNFKFFLGMGCVCVFCVFLCCCCFLCFLKKKIYLMTRGTNKRNEGPQILLAQGLNSALVSPVSTSASRDN